MTRPKKAARRRLSAQNLIIVDQVAGTAGFDFCLWAMKLMPTKPRSIIAQVEGSGIPAVNVTVNLRLISRFDSLDDRKLEIEMLLVPSPCLRVALLSQHKIRIRCRNRLHDERRARRVFPVLVKLNLLPDFSIVGRGIPPSARYKSFLRLQLLAASAHTSVPVSVTLRMLDPF
jgi:hypothetical protein